MKLHRLTGTALALVLVAASARAQDAYPPPPDQPPPPPGYGAPPPPPAPDAPPPAAAATLYAPPALDQMLAPIALYPDPLLTQVLAAATYPDEVNQAAQWSAQNPGLAGPQLAATVEGYDWDPSVKSLAPFPQILAMMDQHLDWTQALGSAFMAQQPDVMDSIQRLRHEAYSDGTLVSSPYESVTVSGNYIEINPTNPQTVYVPVYDPTRVYGTWAYPAYPPAYWGPPPGLAPRYEVGAIGFGIGIGVVGALWHWGDWDWQHHDVRIDRDRFNAINRGRPPIAAGTWHHDATRPASFERGERPGEPGRPQQVNVPPQERRDLQRPEQHAPQQANVPPERRGPQEAAPRAPVPPQHAALPPERREGAPPPARRGEPPQHAALRPGNAPAARPAGAPPARTAAVPQHEPPAHAGAPPHPAAAAPRTAQAPAHPAAPSHPAPAAAKPAPAKPAEHHDEPDHHD